MPVNQTHIYNDIDTAWPGYAQRQANRLDHVADALAIYHQFPVSPDMLAALVSYATDHASRLSRYTLPGGEPLNGQYDPPADPLPASIIAVDGSQAVANPILEQPLWEVINVAGVVWPADLGTGQPMRKSWTTRLTLLDDVDGDGGADQVATGIRRDALEKLTGANLALAEREGIHPVVLLMDGGYELFRGRSKRVGHRDPTLTAIQSAYQSMADAGIVYGGYIAAARCTALIRMLEAAACETIEGVRSLGSRRLFPGLTDGDLLARVLRPGCRSAAMRLVGLSASLYRGDLAQYVIYLNVGEADQPMIVRIETCQAVAADPVRLDLLHAAVIQQCGVTRLAYPHVLTLADRECRISPEEIELIERAIRRKAMHTPLPPAQISPKHKMKRLTRRAGGQS